MENKDFWEAGYVQPVASAKIIIIIVFHPVKGPHCPQTWLGPKGVGWQLPYPPRTQSPGCTSLQCATDKGELRLQTWWPHFLTVTLSTLCNLSELQLQLSHPWNGCKSKCTDCLQGLSGIALHAHPSDSQWGSPTITKGASSSPKLLPVFGGF